MGYAIPQGITCAICGQPVDLAKDRFADEDGKAIHEDCYVKRLISASNDPPGPDHAE